MMETGDVMHDVGRGIVYIVLEHTQKGCEGGNVCGDCWGKAKVFIVKRRSSYKNNVTNYCVRCCRKDVLL